MVRKKNRNYLRAKELKLRLVDTHCHLDFPNYKDDLESVIERAHEMGIVRMIAPGTSTQSSRDVIHLAQKYPDIYAAVGIHPHDADKVGESDIREIENLASSMDKVVAIGEVGLDNYKGYSSPNNQKKLLKECIRIAKDLDKPLILHNREADQEILSILREEFPAGQIKGVVHCFSGSREFLSEILSMGLHVSFTGNITFKKAGALRDIVKCVPLERLLLETDAPFIAPEGKRGRRNEPAYVRYLLGVYTGIYKLEKADIARVTTHNANRLFTLGIEEKPVIAYPIRGALYLNITNRCTNNCTFCTRDVSDFVMGHNLRLEKEPTARELIEAIGDASRYKEIVFCGFGEPTLRLDTIKEVARFVKKSGVKVRLTTNGEGNLINETCVASELKGLVDNIAVSLNAPSEDVYIPLCRPEFEQGVFESIVEFIRESKEAGMDVEVTCVDIIGEEGVDKCEALAKNLGVKFRRRHMDVVG